MIRRHPRPRCLTPEAGIYWLASFGLLLTAAGLMSFIQIAQAAAASPVTPPALHQATRPAVQLTATPFQPLSPTPTGTAAATLLPTPTALPARHFAAGLVEEPARRTTLEIDPGPGFNQGSPIQLNFITGQECLFGSGTACVSRHEDGDLLLLTIHSGLGGQGESFRRAVEGTGIDTALFSLARIQANLAALQGAPVRLSIDGQAQDNLELVGVARVPPDRLQEYFSLPGDEAMKLATQYNPLVQAALESGEQMLAFEICGWSVPAEAWAVGVSPTSASIYLGFIRDH